MGYLHTYMFLRRVLKIRRKLLARISVLGLDSSLRMSGTQEGVAYVELAKSQYRSLKQRQIVSDL